MNKEFCSYEQALALKELGFDEPCLAFYYDKTKFLSLGERPEYLINKRKASYIFGNEDHDVTLAPTFSQAFRWFREEYNLIGNPNHYGGLKHPNMTCNYKISGPTSTGQPIIGQVYDNYEEAELECLKKLIEIVKEKQNGGTI